MTHMVKYCLNQMTFHLNITICYVLHIIMSYTFQTYFSFSVIYIYIYIYMCVCVCVYVWGAFLCARWYVNYRFHELLQIVPDFALYQWRHYSFILFCPRLLVLSDEATKFQKCVPFSVHLIDPIKKKNRWQTFSYVLFKPWPSSDLTTFVGGVIHHHDLVTTRQHTYPSAVYNVCY